MDKQETKSKTSPKGGKRGCLCEDSTYSVKCCKGNILNQGVGSLMNGHVSIKIRNNR